MKKRIEFGSDNLELVANLFPSKKNVGLLCLHGGGVGSKERYLELQEFLQGRGFPSFAFDFRGVGESEGAFEESTLNKRLTDAVAAFDYFAGQLRHIVVLGTSMGAHIATNLSTKRKTAGLILLYGAAYAQEAENKSFTEELSQVLRRKDLWKNSPVFPILEKYKEPVLIAYGKEDDVVPQDIQERFRDSLKATDIFELLPQSGHIILKATTPGQESDKRFLFDKILDFLVNIDQEEK